MKKQSKNVGSGRRSFLKAGATLGAALLAGPTFSGTPSVNLENNNSNTKYRTLGTGKHSLKVSVLGFGCMGMSYHRSFVPDKKAMIALLRKAPELGINLFDTAEAYGPLINEELVGEAVSPFRKEILIATKFGFKESKPSLGLDSRPERIKQVVEHSLKSLRTDYIDLLYQHRVDPNIPMEDVAGTVKDLIKEGKVKNFGMSEANSENIRKAHAVQPLTALQSEYSLMTRQPETDVIKVCEELGIGFVPYSPLSRGLLSGYINERTKYNANNDNRQSLPRYQKENLIANWPLIETLKEFGDHRGLTVAQVALAWLLAQKPFIVPIPGTTKLAHLQENLLAADYEFVSDELQKLTSDINKIKIVGERYTGLSAQQTNK
ncbi:MAG TPA: aldo/keto reductase [Cyclobacteriaceae bacterium]|nr:aldo/keto reductase [Cyclobacteriaceae bacterium]